MSHNTTLYMCYIYYSDDIFRPVARPSSGHRIHEEEKLYSVSHEI